MQRLCKSRWCFVVLGAVISAGCGERDGRAPVTPVTGTVTYNDAPLAGAVVTFNPGQGGHAATGTTDASGKYSLTTWAKGDGAEIGQYRITISKYNAPPESAGASATGATAADPTSLVLEEEYPEGYDEMAASEQPPSENILPDKYASPDTSGFEARVVADEEKNVFDFKLED